MTKEEIKNMSYTDFIGYVNQWNVLPGAYVTINEWAVFSQINQESTILELACTSGFSSRELAILTGCSGVGLDISQASVEMAQYNKDTYAPEIDMEYMCKDANQYTPPRSFSHVVVGAALQFFSRPQKTIDRIINTYLDKEGGYLLASPFYVSKEIPQELVDEAREVFGITITNTGYHETMKLYRDFEVLYENRKEIEQESEDELHHYCTSTIERACNMRGIVDADIKEVMYNRLLTIRHMSNKLRPYQRYAVLVLRYRPSLYPHRYTELF